MGIPLPGDLGAALPGGTNLASGRRQCDVVEGVPDRRLPLPCHPVKQK